MGLSSGCTEHLIYTVHKSPSFCLGCNVRKTAHLHIKSNEALFNICCECIKYCTKKKKRMKTTGLLD